MKRFVKCFFELLTQILISAGGERTRKRGVKRACGRLEAAFEGKPYKTYPVCFRVWNALKIKPF